jgi:DNA/RNA-binding domain of Phe-tRNA-synthetase-like protein
MHFCHAAEIWKDYPELTPGVLVADGINPDGSVESMVASYSATAEARLASQPEGEFPEIQAWRRAFSRMGLEPTQYRCASESLLRRYRKERSLPRIHPLVDLCNAASIAFAIPVAAFDVALITGYLEVRYAKGAEVYESFSGQIEHPELHEVVFADAADRAHARRWTNRQSAYAAVRPQTATVLLVTEAMHETGPADVPRLLETLANDLKTAWSSETKTAILTSDSPQFDP